MRKPDPKLQKHFQKIKAQIMETDDKKGSNIVVKSNLPIRVNPSNFPEKTIFDAVFFLQEKVVYGINCDAMLSRSK